MLGGTHFQNAYVTRDIAKNVARFEALFGMTFDVREPTVTVWTPQGDAPLTAKVALGWHEGLQYELIEPVSGHVDFYRSMLPDDDGVCFHHHNRRVIDWERALADIERSGFPIVLIGEFGPIKFTYADARPQVGHFLEFVWMPDEMWATYPLRAGIDAPL